MLSKWSTEVDPINGDQRPPVNVVTCLLVLIFISLKAKKSSNKKIQDPVRNVKFLLQFFLQSFKISKKIN